MLASPGYFGTWNFRVFTFSRVFCLSIMPYCESLYFIEHSTTSSCFHSSSHPTVGKGRFLQSYV